MRLKDKVAIITGAAGGIGRETALLFARNGAKLILTDRDAERVREVAKEAAALGVQAEGLGHDVTSEQDWIQVRDHALKQFGTIDVLFNNAGIYLISPLVETTVEDCRRILDINVTGALLGMKHVLPHMAEKRQGSIINTSSTSSMKGHPGESIYGASKAAVYNLTQNVALEYAHSDVRINAIAPGFIQTPMAEYAAGLDNSSLDELGKAYHAFARMGQPADIANMALFLASDEASFATGARFVIDGGAMLK